MHDIGRLDLWPIETPAGQDVTIGKGFKGALDDVRLYDRALSEEEIKLLFESAQQ
ncbi:MAG: LamG-like jellyroll fold domain-containing protein [Planctomycetota bacterium]